MSHLPANGFMVLHSNQLEGLRDLAVEFIRNNPLPVLAPEVLLVQSNGMKHWLEMALAKDLGICAATQVELPSRKLWQIYRAVLGAHRVPAQMPLDKSPLVWRIMRRLPELLVQPQFASLQKYLGDQATNDRRAYQLATQLADVLDGYQNYRSDWLEDWANGKNQLRTSSGGLTDLSSAVPLPDHQNWQPELWRDLLEDLSHDSALTNGAYRSRSEVHEAFLQTLHALEPSQLPAGVPQRLMVFGVTSLPMQTVEAFYALGRICQVLMLVQNPCQYFWGHIVESKVPLAKLTRQRQAHKDGLPVPRATGQLSEADQYTLHTDTNPLLAAWGKHGRDYLHLLDTFDDVEKYAAQFTRVDVFVDPVDTAKSAQRIPSQLEHLQSALLNLEAIPLEPLQVHLQDTSIVMVQTHSAQREVEVLHDRILAWLDEAAELDGEKILKPSDIMVMVPDMENFAPHIHAVFGRFANQDPRHLPYSVADTTPRTEPLLQALDMLLQLPQLRITRVEWQSLFEVDAVRARFGLDTADVAQIDTWLESAGVRWGLDTQHRETWGIAPELVGAKQNSWLFGLERLLLGYATGGEGDMAQPWQDTLPQAGVGGLDAHTMQGLMQWLRHIQRSLVLLRQEHTPVAWVHALRQLVDMFFQSSSDNDERLIERVMAPLENWLVECQLAKLETPLPLVVVREYWMAQLQQPAMQRRFFGAGVHFATLMPMRSIPFKIVCLLGMNDGDYPRSQTPRDFDLMAEAAQPGATQSLWRAGDRSRREDDRYLFLEALLSARQKLYISWQGRRTTDHEVRPPSVVVAQLIDYLNAVWKRGDALAFDKQDQLQPLQAFSPKYFTQSSGFTTYAKDWQNAVLPQSKAPSHNANLRSQRHTLAHTLTLQQLERLLKQPADVFIRDRLGLQLEVPDQASAQEEPFALNQLEKYLLTQTITKTDDPQLALARLRLSGELAIAGFGQAQEQVLLEQREELLSRLTEITKDWPTVLAVQGKDWTFEPYTLHAEWANGQGQHLWRANSNASAWLQIEMRAGSVLEGKESNKQARAEILTSLWLHHIVACASGTPTTSVQIGLNGVAQFNPIAPKQATQYLHELVLLYVQAWQQALPVARKSACKYLVTLNATNPIKNESPDQLHRAAINAAMQAFAGGHQRMGEFLESTSLQRVFKNFSDIEMELPTWSQRLYGAMVQHAQLVAIDATRLDEEPTQ
ncbi:MAG: exodeoxyribonuclease V subunit gamma [Burkholderiales bacterium]|nr:exodeoxyribonuclease V subunit gamma [Burkholderiales bacterium]